VLMRSAVCSVYQNAASWTSGTEDNGMLLSAAEVVSGMVSGIVFGVASCTDGGLSGVFLGISLEVLLIYPL
jgi:hypothetical protein